MLRKQPVEKLCAYCHALFIGPQKKVYCKRLCQLRSYYERRHITTEEKRQRWVERAPMRERVRMEHAKYKRLRKAIVAEGTPMLNDEELREEIREQTRR